MRYRNLAAFALCAVACVLFVLFALPAASVPLASFSVKIDMPEGHGSGAHIGNGFILTAAHVVDGRAPTVVTNTGARQDAEVLWLNREYDVALLRIHDHENIGAVPLACSDLPVGTVYSAYGSPGSVDFVHASGEVVGAPEKRGPWLSVAALDGTVVMGMSGGAIVSRNRVVGVAVGVQTVRAGLFPTITGFGFAVPSRVVCDLMGRP
ncbi:trypsin-like peptidase domain-containing protein [Ancylobacter sp.]|uniref:trypsin-like peptidase domain-containing protein n=1 Tax=Ancylobacter sp. TaxID=1872567 RepID=UPI003BAB1014